MQSAELARQTPAGPGPRAAGRQGRRAVRGMAGGAGITLALSLLAFAAAPSASAAAPGQYVVGATAVPLTQPSDALLGRMTPAPDADTRGMFGAQLGWPVIPVHVALAPNGHLVSYGTPVNVAQQGGVTYDDWNPALGTVPTAHAQTPSMASYNSFCNNLVAMPDGRMLMVGGNGANQLSNMTMYYDPVTKAESMGPGLLSQRWYATVLRRPDDRFLVLGGGDYYSMLAYQNPANNAPVRITPEIGNGIGGWTAMTGATSVAAFGAANNHWWYPRAFNAPDGSVFGVSGEQLWRMSTAGAGAVTLQGTLPTTPGVSGAAVMYAPGKILLAGGGEVANATATTATNAATLIDISGPGATVTPLAPMTFRRQWDNATVLPNGEVFVNGGTVVGTNGGAANSSYTSEIWNPVTRTWRLGATAQRIRTYHSTAVLMPSGMVLTGGGGVPGPEDNFNTEPYYPSSLFTRDAANNVVWAARPQLTSIAGNLTWGGQVTVTASDNRAIASVSLISAGSVTHSENTDQRRVPLPFTQNGATLTVGVPGSRDQVPPGTYLLTAVDTKGVPSPSQIVTIRNGGAGSVTVFEPDQSAGQIGGGGGVVPGVVPLTVGTTVSLESVNFPGYRVRHANFAAVLNQITATAGNIDRLGSAWVVRAGLASAAGVSLESVDWPGYFLKVENGVTYLRANDGSAGFAANATFLPKQGLQGQNTSLVLFSDRTLYLRHQGFVVKAQPFDGSDLFRLDATFSVRPPLGPQPGWYSVANTNSKLALALNGGGLAAGTSVVQATVGAQLAQEWELRDAGNGQYLIVNAADGLVLGINQMSTAPGGTALVWGDTGTADHLWTIFPRSGHWLLRNVNSGLVLGVNVMSTAPGAQVLQWGDTGTADHFWDLTQRGPAAAPGRYQVLNLNSRQALNTAASSTAHGALAVQDTPSAAATQTWELVQAGPGLLKIRNVGSGWVLGITGMSLADGGTALVWDDNGTSDHVWRLVPQNGNWLVVNANSNKVLGVQGMSLAPGAQVLQWNDNGTADHLWSLTAR